MQKHDNNMPIVIQNKQAPGAEGSQQDLDMQDLFSQGRRIM